MDAPLRQRNENDSEDGDRSLLKEIAYRQLKHSIMTEEFPPGTTLAERKLALRLGMSKTPVKAALERLVFEGFVSITPQQCILVREMTPKEIEDQYEIRTAMESFVVRSLAPRIQANEIARLEQSLQKQSDSLDSKDVQGWVEHDAEFHLLLAELHGNDAIYRFMLELRDRMFRVINRVFQLNPVRFQDSIDEHRRIVHALAGREPDTAATLIAQHLDKGRQLVLSPG